MYVCVSGSKKCYFFGKFGVGTLWIPPDSVFVDALMMHLKAIISQTVRKKSWFGLTINYKRKCFRKPVPINLQLEILKNFSPVETLVVPLGETKINKLLKLLHRCG